MPGARNGTSPASLETTFHPTPSTGPSSRPRIHAAARGRDGLAEDRQPPGGGLFPGAARGLPCAEADRLAHTLAGTDLLNAAWSLARKARTSGDLKALAQAVFAARDAQDEHRL